MELDAVASMIIQKLRDVVAEEEIRHNKVIAKQVKEMREALEKMQGFFTVAASKARNIKAIRRNDEYLKNLYEVEDTIESFVLRITRQRKRMGFLMNYAPFLKNFTPCKMLSRKLVKLQKEVKVLNETLVDVEDASHKSQQNGERDGGREIHAENMNNTTQSASISSIKEDDDGSSFRYLQSNTPVAVKRAFDHADLEDYPTNARHITSSITEGRSPSRAMTISSTGASIRERTRQAKLNYSTSFADHPANARDITSSIKEGSSPKRLVRSLSLSNSITPERLQQIRLFYNSFRDEEELYIVGFQQDVHDLVKRLTKEHTGDDRIISLVGERGSGKTTLAHAVYRNRTIKEYFESPCAWITITKDSSTKDLLLSLINQVGGSKDQDGVLTEQMLQTRVCERLRNRKYLIVLDGVWSCQVWEDLKNAFPDDKNGSKIILTTSSDQVATYAYPKSPPHSMNKLGDQDSWKLFLNKVGSEETRECSTQKKRIIDICKGLPLNIVLLGSLFSTKKDEDYKKILDNIQEDILSFCYNDLDAHSKLCLLYLMLFPQEYDIPVRRLLRLWLAEGFVKRSEKEKFQEDVAQEYFDNLVKRSLIQISKVRSDGSPRKCRLLGALHDYLSEKARDISLFHVHRNSDCHKEAAPLYGGRRLVEYADAKSCGSQFQYLRSYISFNFQKKDIPATGVADLLGNMICKGIGLLRVLDLEGLYKPSLPDNFGDLFHLRYLGLRWTFLDKLPKSVGNLLYLEL